MKIESTVVKTPLGFMVGRATITGLVSLDFSADSSLLACSNTSNPILQTLEIQLQEYFEGRRERITVVIEPKGTQFQMWAWNVLRDIPYASTISYSEEALRVCQPRAIRAAANANGKNPISIIIPCHRVISKGGGIGGYSGGVWRKEFLLEMERDFARKSL